jgi:hypothetical protein
VDRQHPGGGLPRGSLRRRRVEVQGALVDVAEGGCGALVQQTVGGGDEAERRGDDLIALAPAELADREVERIRAAGDRDRVGGSEPIGEGPLEVIERGPERERP